MKTFILFLCLTASLGAVAQGDSMYVSGRFLYNHCGEKVVLRGVNYPVLDDWDFPGNMNNGNERLKEIERSGANCVRIEWFNDYGNPRLGPYSLKDLDSLLTRCARAKMIPIVGLWDLTTTNDWDRFPQVITAWWTQPAVVQLIKKHQRYLIINLANEMGTYFWSNYSPADLVKYETNYKACIASVRNAGIQVPLMIDATDGGSRLDVLRSKGPALISSDPLKNILLDVHTYWIIYPTPNPTAAQIQAEFKLAVDANLPLVIGEVASYQSESGEQCTYSLAAIYPEVLQTAKMNDIGWMAWCWYKDKCYSRQLSSTGLFANLTPWGNDFINNPQYGIKGSIRSASTFNACPCVLSRTYRKICPQRNGRARVMICREYKNPVTGRICEIKCPACAPPYQ